MLDRILVPVDGSALAEEIFPYVEVLRRPKGSPVTLVHVLESSDRNGADPDVTTRRATDQIEAKAAEYLFELAARLRANHTEVATALLRGSAPEQIVQFAKEAGCNIIAMTTHGRSGLGRFVYGSVADKILHNARMPVFLVRPHNGGTQWTTSRPLRRVLVPLDGSDLASQAIPYAVELARCLDLQIRLTRVVAVRKGVDGPGAVDRPEETARSTEEDLADARDALSALGLRVETSFLKGDAGERIVEAAHEDPGTVVVMASRGLGESRWVLGSTAETIVQSVGVPTLVIRPAGAVQAGVPEFGRPQPGTFAGSGKTRGYARPIFAT